MLSNEHKSKFLLFDLLINHNISFAVYRLPGEQSELNLILQQDEQVHTVAHVSELMNQEGFVIAPFQQTNNKPVVVVQPNIERQGKEAIFSFLADYTLSNNSEFQKEDNSSNYTFDNYSLAFSKFTEKLNSKEFQKIVLSRPLDVYKDNSFSTGLSFENAVSKHSNNFVYLCHTPTTGTWLGSTPEVLLSGKNKIWNTVALAGTKHISDNKSWDDKNKVEQQIVVDFVKEQLNKIDCTYTHSTPTDIQSGTVIHRKSSFNITVPNTTEIGALLENLHPTPAVCGFPKKETFKYIIEHEEYDRRYYSGFIGRLGKQNQTDLYVNLRCMEILDKKLRLYAGGGLLSSSELNSEWKETENKLQTMLSIIND